MKDYYTKEDGHLVIKVPLLSKRSNPYDEEYWDMMPTFTGIIEPQKNCSEPRIGLAFTIDMSYKDKGDQWTDIEFNWLGNKEEFLAFCDKAEIGVVEYQQCANCKGAILGCATSSMELTKKYGGPVCSISCEK